MIFKAIKGAVGAFKHEWETYGTCQVEGGNFERRKGPEAEEGRRLRANALSEAGVDLSVFTPGLAEADADAILGELLPEATEAGCGAKGGFDGFNPQNLTRTGAVPKNVMEADIVSDRPTDCTLICHIKYMEGGKVNMAEVHLWRHKVRLSFWVRRDSDSYTIKCIECYWVAKDYLKPLYNQKHPGGKDPREVLSEAFEEVIVQDGM
jgi:hypothetical protein